MQISVYQKCAALDNGKHGEQNAGSPSLHPPLNKTQPINLFNEDFDGSSEGHYFLNRLHNMDVGVKSNPPFGSPTIGVPRAQYMNLVIIGNNRPMVECVSTNRIGRSGLTVE